MYRQKTWQKTMKTLAPALGLILVTLAAVACAPKSPEERIALIRSGYTVELNSFKVVEPQPAMPAEGEMAEGEMAEGAEGEAAAAEPAEAAAEGEAAAGEEGEGEAAEATAGPATVDVRFDVVIFFRPERTKEGIDQLTIDITRADPETQEEKEIYHQVVDTSGMLKGDTRQVDFVLEGITMDEGDAFAASVRSGIPADLSAYPEFSAAGGQ